VDYPCSSVRVRLLLVSTLVTAALTVAAPAFGDTFTKQDLTIAGTGATQLAATLYEPTSAPPAGGYPAIVMFHGLGGTRASMNVLAEGFFATQGYVVLTFDARGHGESGGLWGLDGPNENGDARALHDFLAARPEVNARKLGAYGISLGGGAVWNSTAIGKVPWAAIVPEATWTNLYEALLPQNLPKSGVIAQLGQLVPDARTDPEILAQKPDAIAGTNLPALHALTDSRSVRGKLGSVTTPTLMLQGRRDFLFDVDQALAAYRELAGPKRLYLGDFGHAPSSFASPDLEYMEAEARQWFDRFLKDEPNGIDKRPPIELAKSPFAGTVQYPGVPPTTRLVFHARGGAFGDTGAVVRTFALPKRRLETFGAATVSTSITSSGAAAHVIAVLSVVAPGGSETIVSEGGVPAGVSKKPRKTTIRLMNQVVPIASGSRLKLTLAGTSTAQSAANLLYLFGNPLGSRVGIGRLTVHVSVLRTAVSR
jgi:predicted acyl esterase